MLDPYEFEEEILENGMRVYLKKLDYASLVNVGIVVDFGGRDGKPGIAHVVEHSLSMKPGNFSEAIEIERAVSKVGGYINLGSTRRNAMIFKGRVPCGKEEVLFRVFSQLLTRASFPEKKFYLEKSSVKREIVESVRSVERVKLVEDIKFSVFHEKQREHARHMISQFSILGTPEEVDAVTIEDVIEAYQEFFVPTKISVVIVGNFNKTSIMSLLNQYTFALKEIPGKQKVPFQSRKINCSLPIYPKSEIAQVSLKEILNSDQKIIDYCAVELNSIVEPGYDDLPMMFKEIFRDMIFDLHRTRQGKMYSPDVSVFCYDDVRRWNAVLMTDTSSLDALLADIQKALTTAAHDEKLFSMLREEYIVKNDSFNESSTKIMEIALSDVVLNGRVVSLTETKEISKKVYFADYENFAEKLIDAIATYVVKP